MSASVVDRAIDRRNRRMFLRLFNGIIDELRKAVHMRVAEGHSQSYVAAQAGLDPAFLSRMLAGTAGTNLRSVAAVLAATDCVLKLEVARCEDLKSPQIAFGKMAATNNLKNNTIVLVKTGDSSWSSPHLSDDWGSRIRVESNFHQTSHPLLVTHGD